MMAKNRTKEVLALEYFISSLLILNHVLPSLQARKIQAFWFQVEPESEPRWTSLALTPWSTSTMFNASLKLELGFKRENKFLEIASYLSRVI